MRIKLYYVILLIIDESRTGGVSYFVVGVFSWDSSKIHLVLGFKFVEALFFEDAFILSSRGYWRMCPRVREGLLNSTK